MRRYLSSFRLGDHPERLVALLTDPSVPAAIIPNACDGYPADGRAEGVQPSACAPWHQRQPFRFTCPGR
jgi:dipeptidase E